MTTERGETRVGVIGCGTIGSALARAVAKDYAQHARVVALNDVDISQAKVLARQLRPTPAIVAFPQLLKTCHLIIEAAHASVAGEVVRQALTAHRAILVMSVGGLLTDRRWVRLTRRSRGKVYIPSGALAGLDGVKALAVGTIQRVSLTTRKPPRALAEAPYMQRRRLDLSRLTRPTLLFEGSPQAAVQAFPQNTNVAAALTLALTRYTGQSQRAVALPTVRIRVVADPSLRVNVHELEVKGDGGRIHCQVESTPSANPKTSQLAVQSAVATLGRLFDSCMIGT